MDTPTAGIDLKRGLLAVAALASIAGLVLTMAPARLLGGLPLEQAPVVQAPLVPSEQQSVARTRVRGVQADGGVAAINHAPGRPRPTDPNAAVDPKATLAEQRAKLEREQTEQAREREQAEQARALHERVEQQLQAERLVAARRRVVITMYSTSWCGSCKRARAYMQEQSIEFEDFDVQHDAEAHARAKVLNPSGSVPVITIDDGMMVGFSAESLDAHIEHAAKVRARL